MRLLENVWLPVEPTKSTVSVSISSTILEKEKTDLHRLIQVIQVLQIYFLSVGGAWQVKDWQWSQLLGTFERQFEKHCQTYDGEREIAQRIEEGQWGRILSFFQLSPYRSWYSNGMVGISISLPGKTSRLIVWFGQIQPVFDPLFFCLSYSCLNVHIVFCQEMEEGERLRGVNSNLETRCSELTQELEQVKMHIPPTRPHDTPRKYAFLPCGHLDFQSAVTAQNDKFEGSLIARIYAC